MKTKLFTLLLLFASIAYSASAYKIIIRGGGSNNRYYEIIVTNNMTSCTGAGHNTCPVAWAGNGHTKIGGVPLNDIMGYVQSQLKTGRNEGQVVLEGRLPCYWRMLDKEYLEIDIKSDEVTGLNEND